MPKRGETVVHTYAGILGPLAMFAALARGVLHGSGPLAVITAAWVCLLVFACIGGAVGALAGWTVEQSVRATVWNELAAAESDGTHET